MLHLPPSLRVVIWTACINRTLPAVGGYAVPRLLTRPGLTSGKALDVGASCTPSYRHEKHIRDFSSSSCCGNAKQDHTKTQDKAFSQRPVSAQPAQAQEESPELAKVLRTLTRYKSDMTIPKHSEYPEAPSPLFDPKTVASGVQNLCQNLRLSMEIEVGYKDKPIERQTKKQLSLSTTKYFVCDLRLQIPDVCDDTTTGEGLSKTTAKQAAWYAMLAHWYSTGKWDELYAEFETPRLAEIDEATRRTEKDAKLEIYNYAAGLGEIPQFSAEQVTLGGRRRRNNPKPGTKVKVAITMDGGRISVSALGNDLPTAELAAALKFKEEAERQSRSSSVNMNSTGILTVDNAKDFVEFYKSKHDSSIEVEYELTRTANTTQNGARVTIDDQSITTEPIRMNLKKEAVAVAHLVAAVKLSQEHPELLIEFAEAQRKGNGKILNPLSAINFDVDYESLRLMRSGLLAAREAGLPDARETLEAEELQEDQQGRFRKYLSRSEIDKISKDLSARQQAFENDPQHAELRAKKAALPITQQSRDVASMIRNNVYSIVIGATGSGKTTQVPQILLERAIAAGNGGHCNIICTQPRRIAATSVAHRVAHERGESLQQSVGYHVRFDARLPQPGGSIKYCTTGILLEQLKHDPHAIFDSISYILIDEVHERDLNIDFLMVVIKNVIDERKAAGKSIPHVVLMSATVDAELFAKYFATQSDSGDMIPCPSISVPGRTFPVKEHFLGNIMQVLIQSGGRELAMMRNDPQLKDYLQVESEFSKTYIQQTEAKPIIDWKRQYVPAALDDGTSKALQEKQETYVPVPLIATTVAHISSTTPDGAILVFLPGLEEIVSVERYLKNNRLYGLNFEDPSRFKICLLHSTIPKQEQGAIFEPAPNGCRKIILSTNIAETSVTVTDVKYVVDSGKMRETRYDQTRRITRLQCVWESKSNARQRAGRAGRVQDGNYYAMFPKERQQSLRAVGLPELLRTELAETALQVKASFPHQQVQSFLAQAIEPPDTGAVAGAVASLKRIEAFTEDEQITDLGRVLSRLPVHPALGKIILMGIIYRCLDPMIIFGAATEERGLFVTPLGRRNEAREIHRTYTQHQSDHIALLEAFKELRAVQNESGFHAAAQRANEQFLHVGAFRTISQTAEQIEQLLVESRLIPRTSPIDRKNFKYGPAELNKNSDNPDLIKSLLIAGLHPNLASKVSSSGMSYRTANEYGVLLHPSSLNHNREGKKKDIYPKGTLFAYTSLATSADGNALFARDTSLVTPLMASLFGGRMLMSQTNRLEIDGWLPFFVRADERQYATKMILEFKKAMERMLAGAFRSLARKGEDEGAGSFAEDPIREALAGKVVEVLDQAGGRRRRAEHIDLWSRV